MVGRREEERMEELRGGREEEGRGRGAEGVEKEDEGSGGRGSLEERKWSLIWIICLKLPNQEHFLYNLRGSLSQLFRHYAIRYVHTRTQ